jgi:hypothetical protein
MLEAVPLFQLVRPVALLACAPDAAQRELIDDVLLCLCGWTFPTLLRKSEANR